jgi:hypothetical protein
MPGAADDPEMGARLAAFLDELQQLGWTDGRNVRIDTRWEASPNRAEELVALAPDVIHASSSPSVAPLQRITRSRDRMAARSARAAGGDACDRLSQQPFARRFPRASWQPFSKVSVHRDSSRGKMS